MVYNPLDIDYENLVFNALAGIRLKSIAEYDKANFDIDGKTIIRKMFGEDAFE